VFTSQSSWSIISKLVNVDVTGHMDTAGQIAGVMFPHRLQLLGDGRHVAIIPDRAAAHRESVLIGGDAHRFGKGAGVFSAPPSAHQNDFARLVGRDHQTDAELGKQRGKFRRACTLRSAVRCGKSEGRLP
jgi:hypothetical protein